MPYRRSGKLTEFECIAKAKELGFDDIEFSGINPPEGMDDIEYAKSLRAEADRCGIEISAFLTSGDLVQDEIDKEIARLKHCVDIANALGVKLFRHDVMSKYRRFRSFDHALPTLVKGIREVTEYAQQYSIKTSIENHGLICQGGERVERLVNAVDHPNFGLLLDMGNFLCIDDDPVKASSRVANLAILVHAKDFRIVPFGIYNGEKGYFQTAACNYLRGTPVGRGDVAVRQIMAILQRNGYDGYVDLEYEGHEDCIEALKEGLAYLRSCV
jgi:sugar phosphate isomerase/epimerase